MGVLEEFFSPRNKALNVSSLSKFDQRYFFVADLKERITYAIENSIKNKFDKKNDNLSYEIYTGFESIFYGTVFNWAINNGSFDIEETIKKYLKIYLSYYFEE